MLYICFNISYYYFWHFYYILNLKTFNVYLYHILIMKFNFYIFQWFILFFHQFLQGIFLHSFYRFSWMLCSGMLGWLSLRLSVFPCRCLLFLHLLLVLCFWRCLRGCFCCIFLGILLTRQMSILLGFLFSICIVRHRLIC